jgi:hypothetical protein
VASNGRVGSAGGGSVSFGLRSTIGATMIAWNTHPARQLIPVVITPPDQRPAAAPTKPSPLIAPNAHAREMVSVTRAVAQQLADGKSPGRAGRVAPILALGGD